jgi:SAM-dependent methyltransferase
MKQTESEWYTTWFDTPYYHILYKNRDGEEAQGFMRNLTAFLKLKTDSQILDVACGKGRHAVYLNKIGYNVTGIDLSESSIKYASQYENKSLKFIIHDMCKPLDNKFDAVFNLFTSFGYFEKEEDNIKAIKAMKDNMKDEAFGVIDFLNIHYTEKHLKSFEEKTIDNILFKIEKRIEDGYLFKQINFTAEGKEHQFTERLKCLDLELFQFYFKKAGLRIKRIFGNYNLEDFDVENSERLILIFQQ